MAKKLGVKPQDIAMFDNFGNDLDKVTPVYSPTLAYLLCTVHQQNIIGVTEFDDAIFATFQANKIVSDALHLWKTITDKYENGDGMPVQRLMGEYVKNQVSQKNMQKINQFEKLYLEHLDEHMKTCTDCSHGQST